MRLKALLASLVFSAVAIAAPEKILVWPEGAPNAMANGGAEVVTIKGEGDHVVTNVHAPSLTAYLPKSGKFRATVIVVPGGGHRELWTDHEGHNIARVLNERGIAAYVLHYRLAREPNSKYTIEGDALGDLAQSIRIVRALELKRTGKQGKVGVMGFSAGGQLAALAATRYESLSTRPDFVALVYPGTWPDLKITPETPPMWLLCGSDDRPEVIAGITGIYLKLREAKVPAELHLYDGVPHGFGLRPTLKGPVANWVQQFVDWLKVSKFAEESK